MRWIICCDWYIWLQNENVNGIDVILLYHQAKRVLKFGGKFICLTLAESHVLGILPLIN